MMRKSILLLAFSCGALFGCQAGQSSTSTGQPPAPVASTGSATPKQELTSAQEKGPPPPTIPDELKTEAFHWYGLANAKPVNFTILAQGNTFSGSQTMNLKSVSDGKAIFEVDRTEGLGDQLGTDTISLQKDGIYITKSTKFSNSAPILDMPASVPVGATWKNVGNLDMGTGHHFDQNMTFKVVGEKPVTTQLGSYTALLVSADGRLTIDGKKYRMEQKQWYVKDRGLVKSEISMVEAATPNAKPQVITIQETK